MDVDTGVVCDAQRGDEQAFAVIVEAIVDRFLGVAQRILRDAQLAEDATQQALVNVWRSLPGLREPARFDAWAYRILIRECYSEHRRRRRWQADVPLLSAELPSGADAFSEVSDRDQMERGFAKLSVDHRSVLVLHYYLALPLDRVAEVLDVPVGTVYSRLHRAHGALRGALDADARQPTPARTSETAPRTFEALR